MNRKRDLIPSLFRVYSKFVSNLFQALLWTRSDNLLSALPDNRFQTVDTCNDTSIWHLLMWKQIRKENVQGTPQKQMETYGQARTKLWNEMGDQGARSSCTPEPEVVIQITRIQQMKPKCYYMKAEKTHGIWCKNKTTTVPDLLSNQVENVNVTWAKGEGGSGKQDANNQTWSLKDEYNRKQTWPYWQDETWTRNH